MKSSRMRTPARPMLPPKTPKSSRNPSRDNLVKDPVQVFCRIRPMQSEADLSCIRVVSSSTVALIPPESAVNYKIISNKETQYVFKHIFDTDSTQHECFTTVAQPLVEGLIKGRNGLLFSYGVTGSGKTFTMTGNKQNRGIMPRCLDVLFKTISDYQAKKFVFKPDRLNGFDILSEADAMLERQAEINARLTRLERQNTDIEIASRASSDVTTLCGLDEDNSFAVFITYVEIYNNSVYDLLEPTTHRNQQLQTKIIREDSNHNMFVHGITELEVKSVEDALNAFHVGQKRKRMGHTILNAESSRSHSVFTIRLVQAPVDQLGEYIVQDRDKLVVSQLSLVDLAGSERTNRTKNTGQRLREAGNINNSLMTLRNCLEILRENNMNGLCKKVPYRDSKLTHLFKNFFDGEGQVKMIVCINPRSEDYDESAQVMKFAEITQEVQIARQTPMRVPTIENGLTPGRRRAHQLFRQAMKNLEDNGRTEVRDMPIDLGLVYKLPSFADFQLRSDNSQEVIRELMMCLEDRMRCRQRLIEDFDARQKDVRCLLQEMEGENIRLKTENAAVTATLLQERERIRNYESRIMRLETSLDTLNRQIRDKDGFIAQMEQDLGEKQHQIDRKEQEKEKQRRKFNSKIAEEQDRKKRELELKLHEQKLHMDHKMRLDKEKLRLVTDIVNGMEIQSEPVSNLINRFNSNCENVKPPGSERKARPRTVAVSNSRNRRSKSVGNEKWLEHRTPNPVPLGTILQPYYNAKTVKSPEMKDITSGTSRYCLITQEADTEGEIETKLYKGDVIPTTSGGAQVVFDDVECLKQMSPTRISPPRKRKSIDTRTPGKKPSIDVVESRCSVGIQGGSKKQRL